MLTLQKKLQRNWLPSYYKTSHGSHARGIRRVENEAAFERAFAATKIEASVVLNDDSIIIEKAIIGAKHIEIRFLGTKVDEF